MKRFVGLIACLLLLLATPCFAVSNIVVGKTGDAAITSGYGYLRSIIINTDGTNAMTITAYDNATTASGSKLFSPIIITTSATNRVTVISFDTTECPFKNGIYVDITTAGTVTYDVYFGR